MDTIRKAATTDLDELVRLASLLWAGSGLDELKADMRDFIDDGESEAFLCFDGDKIAAFALCKLRHDYVEGSSTSPVGYLEGIYVEPWARCRGVAGRLLRRCEEWSKQMGCSEFASDVEHQNTVSQTFHEHVGFTEANRIVCYIKAL